MKRRSKRASLSLSTNAIVVLIMAVVIPGLGLTFIRTTFGGLTENIEGLIQEEPEPTASSASDPVTLSRTLVNVGSVKAAAIKLSVYNSYATKKYVEVTLPSSTNCPIAADGSEILKKVDEPLKKGIESKGSETFLVVFETGKMGAETSALCSFHIDYYPSDSATSPDETKYEEFHLKVKP